MKALFNRLNKGLHKDKDKDKHAVVLSKEKLPELPPLPQWPPLPREVSTPTSFRSTKPLPDPNADSPRPPSRIPSDTIPLPPAISQSSSVASAHSSGTSNTPPALLLNGTFTADIDRAELGNGLPSEPQQPSSPRPQPDSTGRSSSRKTTDGSVAATLIGSESQNHKKVAFISPPPTPALLSQPLASSTDLPNPLKTTVSRFQTTQASDARGSTSTAASSSRVNVSSKRDNAKTTVTTTALSTRTAVSPNMQRSFADTASLHPSYRSGTPYSQASQSTNRILATASWSEAAEEDLVCNLGPRERTRQEVLWEIVASEERYVAELTKLKETFIEPLLHPFSYVPPATMEERIDDYTFVRVDSPIESLDNLPIAARFLSPIPGGVRSEVSSPPMSRAPTTPVIDGDSVDTDEEEAQDQLGKSFKGNALAAGRRQGAALAAAAAKFNHPRSPYNTGVPKGATSKGERARVPFPSRSHQSLPPPARMPTHMGSTASLGRQSFVGPSDREKTYTSGANTPAERKSPPQPNRVLRKWKRSTAGSELANVNGAVAPNQLPDDLRQCLEVLEGGIYNGHVALSDSLRKRYEEQYPLVRSLADVFVSSSHILHEYATYVLHLERALEQVDNALSTANETKRPKNQDAVAWMKVCKYLHKLEEEAGMKGETGLAISLSKPFQRLLKYPLLFQNLLYHTDPSTYEYESTLQMVAEVETIVRSIEDEKIQKEERDKTRDAFARIEGLEKDRQLALPKPSRLLVNERLLANLPGSNSPPISKGLLAPPSANGKNVKGKTSFRRLSDVLQPGGSNGIGGKKDLWLVEFNDVVLRCQRTGVTSLPVAVTINSRTNSMPEMQSKAKYATTGRRGAATKPRNLYKFIKIENWAIADVAQPRQGVVSMDEVARARSQVHSEAPTNQTPEEDDEDGNESDESDRKSKMSFSYWGADKVTIHKPAPKPRQTTNGTAASLRRGTVTPTSYGRESSANAKFGTRLVSHGHVSDPNRPASRRTQATPTSRRAAPSDEGHASTRVTQTRPAWDGSTRASTTTPVPAKRVRNISQTTSTPVKTVEKSNNKLLASPAPSEDSGVAA